MNITSGGYYNLKFGMSMQRNDIKAKSGEATKIPPGGMEFGSDKHKQKLQHGDSFTKTHKHK